MDAAVFGALVALAAVLSANGVAVMKWRIVGLGAIAVALGFALSGHAVAAPRYASLQVVVDTVHIVAAGAWIGTLSSLALAGIPASMRAAEGTRGPLAAALVHAFSPMALFAAGVLVLTGTYQGWQNIRSFGALFHSFYGVSLLGKLTAVAIVMIIGAKNWRLQAEARHGGGRPRHPEVRNVGAQLRARGHRDDRGTGRDADAGRHGAPGARRDPADGQVISSAPTTPVPSPGELAPDFTVWSTAGSITLSSLRGKKNVLLAFFPLAFTSVCTAELCDFSTDFDQFGGADVEVLPISVDSVPTLKEFRKKYDMKATLLSDFKRDVSRAYGVLIPEKYHSARAYFLIDKQGKIAWRFVEKTTGEKRTNAEILGEIGKLT